MRRVFVAAGCMATGARSCTHGPFRGAVGIGRWGKFKALHIPYNSAYTRRMAYGAGQRQQNEEEAWIVSGTDRYFKPR